MTRFHVESRNYPSTEGTPLQFYFLGIPGRVFFKLDMMGNV